MLAVLFFPLALSAQLGAVYQFSTGIDNTKWYTLTSDSTLLKVGTGDDSYASPVLNIGFTFNFVGADYTQFSVNSDGTVRLGSTAVGTSYYATPFSSANANKYNPKICGLGCDGYLAAATSDSPADYIAYQLFGSEGDHVLVIEISTGTFNSITRENHYTFQVQLAEADNSVTLIYSPTAPAAGPAVTYQLGACVDANDIVLFNVANNTMSIYNGGTTENNPIGTWPDAGRYYTIAPNPNPCYPVSSLTASNITASSVTLTWSDTNNTGATYTIYDGDSIIASYINDNTYDIIGLDANTSYTFSVVANCSSDNSSNFSTIHVHTGCNILSALPYTDSFEDTPDGNYQMPYCWERYASAHTNSTAYPYSYNGSTYSHSGSSSLYFYGTTSASYSDTMIAIMPELDVTSHPMSGNRVTFWARMGSANNSKNIYVGTMTNPTDPSTFVLVDSVFVNSNTYNMFSVPMTDATGSYVAFVVYKGTGAIYMDDVTLEEIPSCFEVSSLTDSSITSNSVTLQWIDENNTGATYSIYQSDSLIGTSTETNYTITDLEPNTTYTFGVIANCTNGDGNIMTITVTTACAPLGLPFIEPFDVTLANDACWRGATGTTADEVLAGATLNYTANNQWTYASAASNGLPAGHYRVNIYGSTCKKWMITPEIDLTNANSPILSFDAAFTVFTAGSNAPATGFENNPTQKFQILASSNNGQTWSIVSDISLTDIASSSYLTQYADLSSFAGQTIRIAFYAQSTTTGGDNNLHIDNIQVEESTGELCLPVVGLTADNIGATTATLSWDGNADSYNIYIIGNGDTTFVQNITADSLELTNLTAMTAYTYGVCAVCNDDESPINTLTFSTACTAVELPYTETFETTSGTLGCWSTEGNGTWSFGVGDYSITTGAFEGSQNAKITHATTGNVTKLVSPVLDGVNTGMILDFAYVLRTWVSDLDELRVYSRAAADSAWQLVAEYTDEAPTWTTTTLVIPGTVYQIAFEYTDNYGYGVGIDSVVFSAMSGDYCYAVSNLTVSNTTVNSVSLTWSDEDNSGATYTIYNMADNSVVATGLTTTSYDVTGLSSLTSYTFGVVANCSATDESNIVTVEAATLCGGESCNITIVGHDSYGNGWNDNAINIIQNGIIVGTFTLANDSLLVENFAVCDEAPVSFSWVEGSYPNETSFEIIDGANISVYTGVGSNMASGIFFTLDNACAPVIPVDTLHVTLSINDVNLGSITPAVGHYDLVLYDTLLLTATPNAGVNFEGWRMMVGGQTIGTLPLNPYPLVVNPNLITVGQLTVIAIFSDSTSVPDSLTVILNTADATMGTTNPAPGTHSYAVGEQSVISAVPNPGYNFLYWVESATISGMTISDTLYASTVSLNVTPMYANMTLNLTAYFEAAPADPCEAPTGITVSAFDDQSISLFWDDDDNVESWNVRYRAQNGDWNTLTTNTNSYTITGLAPNTTYQIGVQSNCGEGNFSQWSATVTQTTIGLNSFLSNSIVLFPNPAKDVVNVQCTMNNVQVKAIEVFDVYGKLLQTVSMTPETTTINVSGLASGMYFVRVTTKEGSVTKSFVKK